MTISCAACGEAFEAKRRTAKFCSSSCRVRGHRSPKTEPEATEPADAMTDERDPGLVEVSRARLVEFGKLDTVMGQQLMVIAWRLCSPAETGSAIASLSREHSRLMQLLARGAREVDPVQAAKDEVARKRAQRNAG